jgi:predicted Zn-dependent peptidase
MLIDEAVWGDHALGRDVGGTQESVNTIQRDQMLDYLATHYVPANTVVAVAGAASHGEVVDRVGSLLLDWNARPATRWAQASFEQVEPRVEFRNKHTEQAHICLAVPGLSYIDPERFSLDLLNIVLGEGMSSRLFLQIREHKGLAYDVHSYTNYFSDTGSVVIYAGVDPKRSEETVEACLDEVERLKRSGVSEDELGRAKEFWKGRTLLRLEDTRSIAAWLGSQELLLDEIIEVDEVVARIESVTAEDIQAVANQLFVPERLSMAVIGPYRSDRRFLKLLGRPSAATVRA